MRLPNLFSNKTRSETVPKKHSGIPNLYRQKETSEENGKTQNERTPFPHVVASPNQLDSRHLPLASLKDPLPNPKDLLHPEKNVTQRRHSGALLSPQSDSHTAGEHQLSSRLSPNPLRNSDYHHLSPPVSNGGYRSHSQQSSDQSITRSDYQASHSRRPSRQSLVDTHSHQSESHSHSSNGRRESGISASEVETRRKRSVSSPDKSHLLLEPHLLGNYEDASHASRRSAQGKKPPSSSKAPKENRRHSVGVPEGSSKHQRSPSSSMNGNGSDHVPASTHDILRNLQNRPRPVRSTTEDAVNKLHSSSMSLLKKAPSVASSIFGQSFHHLEVSGRSTSTFLQTTASSVVTTDSTSQSALDSSGERNFEPAVDISASSESRLSPHEMDQLDNLLRVATGARGRRLSRDLEGVFSRPMGLRESLIHHKLEKAAQSRRASVFVSSHSLERIDSSDGEVDTGRVSSAFNDLDEKLHKVRILWKRSVLKNVLILLYRGAKKIMDDHVQTPMTATADFNVLRRLIGGRIGNEAAVPKVIELLQDKSSANLEMLERLLYMNVKSFGRYTAQQRTEFCQLLSLVQFPPGRTIVREGHKSSAFYFILYGQVEVFKVKDGARYILATLQGGDSFGDRTMTVFNDKRTASVSTSKNTAFLKIDKAEYMKLVNDVNQDLALVQLSKIPFFLHSANGFLEKITPFTRIVKFHPNEIIVSEGTNCTNVYWIISGSCKCVKVVPFVRNKESGALKSSVPGQKVKKDEEDVHQLLTVCEMESPQFLPNFPLPRNFDKSLGKIKHDEYVEFLKNEDPAETSHWAHASAIAITKMDVAIIEKSVIARFATPEMIMDLIKENHSFTIPSSQLSDIYLQKIRWKEYKGQVRDEIVKKRFS